MKNTSNHPGHLAIALCAYQDCTDRATYHGTPLCREHAAQVWKTFEDNESEEYRDIVRGEFKGLSQRRAAANAGEKTRKRYLSNRPGHVYYLRVADRVKIGFTTDLYSRMMQYPPNSVLLATHPGTPALEKDMHLRFAKLLADGREWFYPHEELTAHIDEVRAKYPKITSIAQMRAPMNNHNATARARVPARRV